MPNVIGAVQVDIVGDQSGLNASINSSVATAQAGGQKIANAFSAAAIKSATLQLSVDTLKQKFEDLANSGVRTAQQQQQMDTIAAKLAITNARLALSLEQVAHASGHAITGVQATSGAIRTLEGTGALRAVENFLAKTLGLGPAMQAIFPVVGAIAFAEVLGHVGKKLYEMWEKSRGDAERLTGEIQKLNNEIDVTNSSLQVGNDKLENELAKLSGKPENGIKLAIDEALLGVDQLIAKLDTAIGKLYTFIKQEELTGVFGHVEAWWKGEAPTPEGLSAKEIGGITGKGGPTKEIDDIAERGRTAIAVQSQIAASATTVAAKQAALDEANRQRKATLILLEQKYGEEIAKRFKITADATVAQSKIETTKRQEADPFRDPRIPITPAPSQERNVEIGAYSTTRLQKQLKEAQLEFRKIDLDQAVAVARAGKESSAAAKRAAEEWLKVQQETLEKAKIHHQVSADEEASFWSVRLPEAQKKYPSVVLAIEKDMVAAQRRSAAEFMKARGELLEDFKSNNWMTLEAEIEYQKQSLAVAQSRGPGYLEAVRTIQKSLQALRSEGLSQQKKADAESLRELNDNIKEEQDAAAEAGKKPGEIAHIKLDRLTEAKTVTTPTVDTESQENIDREILAAKKEVRAADKADLNRMLSEEDALWEKSAEHTLADSIEYYEARKVLYGNDVEEVKRASLKIEEFQQKQREQKPKIEAIERKGAESSTENAIAIEKVAIEKEYAMQVAHTAEQEIAYQEKLAAIAGRILASKLAAAQAGLAEALKTKGPDQDVKVATGREDVLKAEEAILLQQAETEAKIAELRQRKSLGGMIEAGLASTAGSAVDKLTNSLSAAAMQTKHWGQTFRDELKQIESEILHVLIGSVLKKLAQELLKTAVVKSAVAGVENLFTHGSGGGGAASGAVGAVAGGVAKGAVGAVTGGAQAAATGALTAAETANTAATVADTAAVVSLGALITGQVAAMALTDTSLLANTVALGVLTTAVIALTTATAIDAIIPFAGGGDPEVGVPALVGERGPELFIPKTAGTVIPADKTKTILKQWQEAGASVPNPQPAAAPQFQPAQLAQFAGAAGASGGSAGGFFRATPGLPSTPQAPQPDLSAPGVPDSVNFSRSEANAMASGPGGAVTNHNTGRVGDSHFNIYGAANPRETMRQIADFEKRQTGKYSPANS